MEMTLIFDGRSERWVGRVGGIEIPETLFMSLASDRATHFEIMASDILGAVELMRNEYVGLRNAEMNVQKGKNSAIAFKRLRDQQARQLAAIQQLEKEAAKYESFAKTYRQMASTLEAFSESTNPRYVIRG